MNTGPSEPDIQLESTRQTIQFRLRDVVPDKLHYLILTTLPRAKFVDKLWNLAEELGNEITFCINMLYCQVTQRNGSGEGKPHYFYHVGATSIYETHSKKLIKGKNHTLKAGIVFMKVLKTLSIIDKELEKGTEIEKKNLRLLRHCKAELSLHHNVLLFSLQNASEKSREHLKRFQSLDMSKLQEVELSSREQKRIKKIHPEQVDFTPKKPSKAAIKTRDALQATEPANRAETLKDKSGAAKKLFH